MRQCGDCQLCCKLMPITSKARVDVNETVTHMIAAGLATHAEAAIALPEFDKPAGERCPHQRHGKGCVVYERRPFGCRWWNCRWLVNEAGETRRPDRAHYVIDVLPDFITVDPGDGSEPTNIEIVQIWLDPDYPDAHRDPALRAWLAKQGEQGKAALVRLNAGDAMVLIPPAMNDAGQWIEHGAQKARVQHRGVELFAGIAASRHVKFAMGER